MIKLVKYRETLGTDLKKIRELVSEVELNATIQPMTTKESMGLFGEIDNNYYIAFIFGNIELDNSYNIIVDNKLYDILNADVYKGHHIEAYLKEVK